MADETSSTSLAAKEDEIRKLLGDRAAVALDRNGVQGVVEKIAKSGGWNGEGNTFMQDMNNQETRLETLVRTKYLPNAINEKIPVKELLLDSRDFDKLDIIAKPNSLNPQALVTGANDLRRIAHDNEFNLLQDRMRELVKQGEGKSPTAAAPKPTVAHAATKPHSAKSSLTHNGQPVDVKQVINITATNGAHVDNISIPNGSSVNQVTPKNPSPPR